METGFRFVVEKVFTIPGRGVVVSGRVESGTISVGEELGFLGTEGQWVKAVVVAIEVSRRLVEQVEAGQYASFLLQGVKKEQITLGTILVEVPTVPSTIPMPQPSVTERANSIPIPNISYSGNSRAIQPSSGLGRTLIFLLIGLIIILLLLIAQGKLDPQKWDPRKMKFDQKQLAMVQPIPETFSQN